mmetsp:Transcript_58662/g.128379  ORF Transcript_58662/g.128379 Transcript_58662/m.128379 type:complete len:210 (+) Transcript_58662:22-651(+)
MDGRQLVPQAVFAGFTYTQKNCTGQGPMRGNRRRAVLFGAFVHLFQEYLNNFPRHISFLHLILEGKDILEGLGLVVCVLPFQANLLVDIFDLLLFRGLNFTLSIVLVQVCLLLWRAKLMVGLHKEPSALFVLDVRADLPQGFGRRKGVQVVVLGLKVDAHQQQGFPDRIIGVLLPDPCHLHAQSNGQVERVEGSLVLHDELPSAVCEVL